MTITAAQILLIKADLAKAVTDTKAPGDASTAALAATLATASTQAAALVPTPVNTVPPAPVITLKGSVLSFTVPVATPPVSGFDLYVGSAHLYSLWQNGVPTSIDLSKAASSTVWGGTLPTPAPGASETVYATAYNSVGAGAVSNSLTYTAPAAPPPPPPPSGSTLIAWYAGPNTAAQQAALAAQYSPGLPLVYCDGAVADTWADVANETNWLAGVYAGKPVMIPIPLIVTGQSYAQSPSVNAGKFASIAQAFVNAKCPEIIFRLAWEFNGGWYPFTVNQSDGTGFISHFQAAVAEIRAVSPSIKIFWCLSNRSVPYNGQNPLTMLQCYPGSQYVDIIGLDIYQETWAITANNNPTPANVSAAMNDIINGMWGLAETIAFAEAESKPLGIGELGLDYRQDGHGLGDDPAFLPTVLKLATACSTGVAVVEYYNSTDGSDNSVLGPSGKFPNATAGAKAAFALL
jgi:Glycosyl hydrolase family 26